MKTMIPFTAAEEGLDQDGVWNPISLKRRKKRSVQINLTLDKRKIEYIARYLSKLVRQPGWNHEHLEAWGEDGMIRLHFIMREDDKGYRKHLTERQGKVSKRR
jgi:hypothetical protein